MTKITDLPVLEALVPGNVTIISALDDGGVEQSYQFDIGDTGGVPGPSGPTGPAGTPGANVMAVGPFETIAGTVIPAGTTLIHTSRYYAAIIGGDADYVYDPAVDATYVTAHPRTSFLSADARGWRLDDTQEQPIAAFGGIEGDGALGSLSQQQINSAAYELACQSGIPFTLSKRLWCDWTQGPINPWGLSPTERNARPSYRGLSSEAAISFNTDDTCTWPCISVPETYNSNIDVCCYMDGTPYVPGSGPSAGGTGRSMNVSNCGHASYYGKNATVMFLTNISDSVFEQVSWSGAYRGLSFPNGSFNIEFVVCHFSGLWELTRAGTPELEEDFKTSYGLLIGNHATLKNCAGSSWGQTLWLSGAEIRLDTARIEVGECGVRLGGAAINTDLWNGSAYIGAETAFKGFVGGLATESNRIGLWIDHATNSVIGECNVTGTAGAVPGGRAPLCGVIIGQGMGDTVKFRNLVHGIGGALWGPVVNSSTCEFENVQGDLQGLNTAFSQTTSTWRVEHAQTDPRLTTGESNQKRRVVSSDSQTMLRGITGINLIGVPLFATKIGENIPVTASATTVAFTFFQGYGNGNAVFSGALTVSGSGGTIPTGSYAYGTTIVHKTGETGFAWPVFEPFAAGDNCFRSANVTLGQKVTGAFSGYATANSKRRVYKWDLNGAFPYCVGYREYVIGTASFEDDGTGTWTPGTPPPSGSSVPTQVEPDANYEIILVCKWITSGKIGRALVKDVDKATGGFTATIDTDTIPAADSLMFYFLVRP